MVPPIFVGSVCTPDLIAHIKTSVRHGMAVWRQCQLMVGSYGYVFKELMNS
jgi:hypothetical protein